MTDSITCNFNNTITERDMDLLLVGAIASDPDFCLHFAAAGGH